jgi:hypothetical protein
MQGYTTKIDIIYDKIDKNENILLKIIELLQNNNEYLENKINNLEDKIYALQSNVLQSNVLQNNVLQSNVLQSNVLQSNVLQSNVLQSNVLQSNVLQNNALQSNVLQNNALQSNVLQNNALIKNTAIDKLLENNELVNNKSNMYSEKNELLSENCMISEKNNELTTHNNDSINNKLNDKILKNKLKSKDKKQEYEQNNFKELKIEKFDIDDNFIKKCLSESNIESDLKIFKKIYIDNVAKEFYPIRHIKKKYQYWLDGEMKDDDKNGSYIKNTIIKNIELCYTSVNTLDNYVDIDVFLMNQDYINMINDEKYKDDFLIRISEIIKI